MIPWYKFQRYFWALFGVLGVVFFWAGVWDGIGSLPYLKYPWVSFLIGIAILSFSGLVLKEFNPLEGTEQRMSGLLHQVKSHPQKHHFHVKYYDQVRRGHITFRGDKVKRIEKSFVILHSPRREVFIPLHRVKKILHKGKPWKPKK